MLLLQACLKVKGNVVLAEFLYFLIPCTILLIMTSKPFSLEQTQQHLITGIYVWSLEAKLKTWCFFFAFLNYSLVEMWSKIVPNNCKRPISFKLWQKNFKKPPCECLSIKPATLPNIKLCFWKCPIYPCWIQTLCFINHHGRKKVSTAFAQNMTLVEAFECSACALLYPCQFVQLPINNLVSIVYC